MSSDELSHESALENGVDLDCVSILRGNLLHPLKFGPRALYPLFTLCGRRIKLIFCK